MHRRERPARETRGDYRRRIMCHERRVAQDRVMIEAAMAGRPFAVFVQEYAGPVASERILYRAPRATRAGRATTARRARRSRSTSSKSSSPDGSSSDGEPSHDWPQSGRREVTAAGGVR
jgi:hypothetical protein